MVHTSIYSTLLFSAFEEDYH